MFSQSTAYLATVETCNKDFYIREWKKYFDLIGAFKSSSWSKMAILYVKIDSVAF